MASVRLFVYGSLKRGGLHHEELAGCRFLAEERTAPGFELETLRLGAQEYLALVPAPGSGSSVPGEVFEVPEELLPVLDAFEDDAYFRGEVPLSAGCGHALAYLKNSR